MAPPPPGCPTGASLTWAAGGQIRGTKAHPHLGLTIQVLYSRTEQMHLKYPWAVSTTATSNFILQLHRKMLNSLQRRLLLFVFRLS